MPIYEYICKCGCEVEEIQKMGEEAPVCPQCGGVMQLKFSPIAMVKMKGEGGFPSRRKEWRGTAPYTRGYDSTTDPNSDLYKGGKHPPLAESE